MSSPARVVTEGTLRTDLNELSHSLASELAMACKKLSIYSSGHPVGRKSLEKPYLYFTRMFAFREYVGLNLFKGSLYLNNICLKEAIYHAPIFQAMQVMDIKSLRFRKDLSLRDFAIFVERFVKRIRPDDPDYNLQGFLLKANIKSIEANTEVAVRYFESQRQYRGDVEDDFSVKRFVLDQLGSDPVQLARINEASDSTILELGIDFDPAIVRYLLPERVASLKVSSVRSELERLATKINAGNDAGASSRMEVQKYMSLFRLIQFHPERETITKNLDGNQFSSGTKEKGTEVDPDSATGAIKVSAIRQIQGVMEDALTSGTDLFDSRAFAEAFERLLKTGLQPQAEETLIQLVGLLRDANPSRRQKALGLLVAAIDTLNVATDEGQFTILTNAVVAQLKDRRETFEYSELIWKLCERFLLERRYDLMASVTEAMASRRHFDKTVTVYDSMAVKKAFETLNRSEVRERLIKELIPADHETANRLKRIMVSIGSEEMALSLSQVVAHPLRHVRQQALRVLAELGKASLKVFSRIVMDDSWFERDTERHELADAKWYVVRNSIFVLGSLRDSEAVPPLRLRISDHDIRVRREIVSALEKIGGDDAVDLLVLMAEDTSKEIRESAIGAIGVIGSIDSVPLLLDIARRKPSEIVQLIGVLGKLGGEEALTFLGQLLFDDEQLSALCVGRISKDDLRLAIVKALGGIGDKSAVIRLREYQNSLSPAQKLLFKNSPLHRAIAEILSRQ